MKGKGKSPVEVKVPEYWAILWREKDDWGWLSSLDGMKDCTTQEPVRRLRYASRAAAMVALWKFRRDNTEQPGETLRLVRVRVWPASVLTREGRADLGRPRQSNGCTCVTPHSTPRAIVAAYAACTHPIKHWVKLDAAGEVLPNEGTRPGLTHCAHCGAHLGPDQTWVYPHLAAAARNAVRRGGYRP